MMREFEAKTGHTPESRGATSLVDLAHPPSDPETALLLDGTAAQVREALDKDALIDLQIDWGSLDRAPIFDSLRNYDNAHNLYPKVSGSDHEVFLLHTAELKTKSGEVLKMDFTKVASVHNGMAKDELRINIVRPNMPDDRPLRYVSAFTFVRDGQLNAEEWEMIHRRTEKPYRKQGIGDEVLKIAEEIFGNREADNHLKQSISAKSGQKDLTRWLTNPKRGFAPATTDDAKNLARLNSPNSGLQDVTRLGVTYTFDPQDFSSKFGNLIGPEDPAVWEDYSYGKPYYYFNSCFKIKLKK